MGILFLLCGWSFVIFKQLFGKFIGGGDCSRAPQGVRSQAESLKHIQDKLEALNKKRAPITVTDKLAEQLLKDYKAPAARHKQYAHRLSYGLRHYYISHYQPSSRHAVDE